MQIPTYLPRYLKGIIPDVLIFSTSQRNRKIAPFLQAGLPPVGYTEQPVIATSSDIKTISSIPLTSYIIRWISHAYIHTYIHT